MVTAKTDRSAHGGCSRLVLGIVVHAHEPHDLPDEAANAEGDASEEDLVDDELAEGAAAVLGQASDDERGEASEDEEEEDDDDDRLALVEVLAEIESLVVFFFAAGAHV